MHGQGAYLVIAFRPGPGPRSAADAARAGEHIASATLEIRLPNLAGGPAGTLPRSNAAALRKSWRRPVVVESRAGTDGAEGLRHEDVRKKFHADGAEPVGNTPPEMVVFPESERVLWVSDRTKRTAPEVALP
jgi:hypothetical protein